MARVLMKWRKTMDKAVIQQRAKRLANLHLDGLSRIVINRMVAAVLDGLDDDTADAALFLAEEIVETLPRKHNRPRFR